MDQFISWYCSEPRLALNRTVVLRFRLHLESLGLAAATINQRLAAVRRLAFEADRFGPSESRIGRWHPTGQRRQTIGSEIWKLAKFRVRAVPAPPGEVRRRYSSEQPRSGDDCNSVGLWVTPSRIGILKMEDVQIRQGHWAIVDLIGKGGHVRTVPMPNWVKGAVGKWTAAAQVTDGRIFRAVSRHGSTWGRGISENVVWYVVRSCARRLDLEHIAPHDLRRTCAKPCHSNGGELEQIQFLLGHASVLTTERYLGCKQNLEQPVNDRFGPLIALKEVETS